MRNDRVERLFEQAPRSVLMAGGVVNSNTAIGSNVIVGAGATVLEDVPDGATVVGTPARRRGS